MNPILNSYHRLAGHADGFGTYAASLIGGLTLGAAPNVTFYSGM